MAGQISPKRNNGWDPEKKVGMNGKLGRFEGQMGMGQPNSQKKRPWYVSKYRQASNVNVTAGLV